MKTLGKGFMAAGGVLFWGACPFVLVASPRTAVLVATLLLLVVLAAFVFVLVKCFRFRKLPEPAKLLVVSSAYGAAGGLAACAVGFAIDLYWAFMLHS
jgi:hypothetical protein